MILENKWRDNVLRPFLNKMPCDHILKEAANLRGFPDIIGVLEGGRFFALEVKRCHSEMADARTNLQAYRLKCYRKRGAVAEFIYPENARVILLQLISALPSDLIPSSMSLLDVYFPET